LVFLIRYPGSWLDLADRDAERRISNSISTLEYQATDAFVALNLFLPELSAPDREARRRTRDREAAERSRVEADLRAELGEARYYADHTAVSEEVERRAKNDRWARGETPHSYTARCKFIYAHAFLYAVDGFGKVLATLAKDPAGAARLSESSERHRAAFPGTTDVRDSAQHIEDRGRGYDRKGKPLDLKPIVNSVINAPNGGVLILGSLFRDQLTYTASSGSQASISISVDSAKQIQARFQEVLDAFPWKGPARLLPD
jgi:hypothetical protein